jgi:hypothetical protein
MRLKYWAALSTVAAGAAAYGFSGHLVAADGHPVASTVAQPGAYHHLDEKNARLKVVQLVFR